MMRYNFLLLALLNFNCNDLKATFMQDYKIIDLTHDVHPEIPTWDMTCGYFVKNMRDYKHCEGEFKFRSQALDIRASAGTHLDSPAHCFEGAADISQIPVDQLIVPCVVIDVSHQKDILYKATAQDILDFEKHYGEIKAGTLVFFNTGWAQFWNEPQKYHNNLKFPSISAQAAQLLLQRNVVGIGIDTLSPDCDEKGSFVHAIMLGNNKYIIENVGDLSAVPAVGATALVMPLKVQGAAESPIRLIVLVPEK